MRDQVGSKFAETGLSTSNPALQVAYQPISAIKPDPRNARSHPKSQIAQLRKSIETFGFTNPIIIDNDNVVIAGHGRLLAAKAMGLDQAPTIRLSHLNDAQRRALRLADNKIALNSGWDNDLLRVELTALSAIDSGIEIDVLGFSTAEIDVRLGEAEHGEFAMASGEMSPEAFADFLRTTLGGCADVSRSGAVHFVCMDWRHGAALEGAVDGVYARLLNVCVWNKSNAGMGALYRSKHELIYVFRVGDAQHFNAVQLGRYGRNRSNVWDYPSVNTFNGSRQEDLTLHPTVKPVGLVADAIQDVTRRGDVVLDAFMGAGTTLLAAERTGRRCRGVEIEPAYVEVALQR